MPGRAVDFTALPVPLAGFKETALRLGSVHKEVKGRRGKGRKGRELASTISLLRGLHIRVSGPSLMLARTEIYWYLISDSNFLHSFYHRCRQPPKGKHVTKPVRDYSWITVSHDRSAIQSLSGSKRFFAVIVSVAVFGALVARSLNPP